MCPLVVLLGHLGTLVQAVTPTTWSPKEGCKLTAPGTNLGASSGTTLPVPCQSSLSGCWKTGASLEQQCGRMLFQCSRKGLALPCLGLGGGCCHVTLWHVTGRCVSHKGQRGSPLSQLPPEASTLLSPALEGELLVLREEASPWGCLEEGQVKLRIALCSHQPAREEDSASS